MIYEFDQWSANRVDTNQLSDLADSVLAIEASWYLDRLLNTGPSQESLLAALGGLPFALRAYVEDEFSTLQAHNIRPLFIFNGLNVGRKHAVFQHGESVSVVIEKAWDLYNQKDAQKAVDTFGSSGYASADKFFALLQTILRDLKVEFMVAPYSAWGQLAYLSRYCSDFVDAIAGSSELLLFDVDRVITKIHFDSGDFTFVRRQHCVEELGGISSDMFIDACILSGSAILPTLPTLSTNPPRRNIPRVRQALDMMRTNGQSGISVCLQFQDEPKVRQLDYVDRFRRSRLALKHQIVLTQHGKVEPFEPETAPNDLHELIGQRLPDELYYYLSVGAISSRVLNQLTSNHVYEMCPPDGGHSETYRQLVIQQLNPIRQTTLSLMAHYLFRSYLHRNVQLSCWFAPDRPVEISLNEATPPKPIVEKWLVREDTISSIPNLKGSRISIKEALQALSTDFAPKTIRAKGSKDSERQPLRTDVEIRINSLWRFLHLRNYIDNEHKLTSWGKVLSVVLSAMPVDDDLEEASFLAVELLRLGLLSSDNMFPTYTGGPMRGSENDKGNCLLLSRIACLGRLKHKNVGFTGPLSRHLLGYNSIISAVRTSLRDLVEMSFATLMLSGDVLKERADLTEIGLDLPFLLHTDCGLGIAMKHYLDELLASPDPTSAATREETKERGPKDWFPYAEDVKADLGMCFGMWDAIYAGIRVAVEEKLIKDGPKWDAINKWVQERR